MIYNKFLCLGDSITYGSRDEYNRAWPFELSDLMWKKYGQFWIPIVKAEPGLTTAGLMRKVYDWISIEQVYYITVLIGTNDAKPKIRTPPDIFKKNYLSIMRTIQIQQPNTLILICTIPDIGKFGSPDFSYNISQPLIDEYNNIIYDINLQFDSLLVDLRGLPDDVYVDSVHFLNKGSIEIAKRVLNAIEKNFDNR